MAVTRLTTNGLTGTKYDIASADNYYMEPIATTLVGSGGASSVSFSSIPQGYKHLQIRTVARGDSGSPTSISLTFNGDTNNSNYYSRHLVYGDGSTAASIYNATLTGVTGGSVSANTTYLVGPNIIDVIDYSSNAKYKTVKILGGYDANGSGAIGLGSGLWMNIAAITSITFTSFSGNFTQNTRLSLYGIKG